MDVVITGIGLISCLGDLECSWKRLLASQSGIQLHQPFLDLPVRPLGMIGAQPSDLASLTKFVVAAALEDAGLVPPLQNCGVVIGSSRAYQAQWELWSQRILQNQELAQGAIAPPALNLTTSWLETLPHMNAIAAARQIGSTNWVLAPMAACATGLWAIAQGFELIRTGQCERAIAGAVEAPISPLTLTGFAQMGALAKTGAYPFDRRREGLVLGEGGAVFLLESAAAAQRRSAPIYGKILGVGLTADAVYANAPEPGGKSAIAAVQQCCDRSGIPWHQIDYIHAHGTSTQLNDQAEACLIEQLFSTQVPVSSTKGATGHTLGASGAFGVAFCLKALQQQLLPPCVGLQEPEFDLDFVRMARASAVKQVLCLSFGFGGQNAAIALGKAE